MESKLLFLAMITFATLLHVDVTESANILALFPFSSRSHNNVYSTLTKALAQRGHKFTVVTSQPMESPPPNYKQIDVYQEVAHIFTIVTAANKTGPMEMFRSLRGAVEDVCGKVMKRDEMRSLANPKPGEKFDLVLITNFFSECFYPFARIYDAPIVLLSPGGPMPSTYSAVGNVVLPSFYPDPLLGYSDRMDFKQRLVNTATFVAFRLFYKYYIQGTMEIEMRAAFGEDTPSISELEEHVSLALINNHFSLNEARHLVPGLVEVGGLHIKPPKDLPKDLKSFLDGAGEQGAIYFSLGSVIKSSQLPKEKRDAFISAFSKVKQRVLWKWEGENPLPGMSNNVKLEKWLPQQDVLAHPNVKLFITHGGLLSFQEAANRGVPLVGIPHFADQDMNMQRVLDLEVGVKLDAENLTADVILGAINQVLGNPKFAGNMRRLQAIVSDQRDDPLERAVYWVEYVLRHGGAKHLKPASFHLHWYQTYMLDVLLVLALASFALTLPCALLALKVAKKVRGTAPASSSSEGSNEKKKTQ